METIFDLNVTENEIQECGFLSSFQRITHGIDFPENMNKSDYLRLITKNAAIFDIALLLEQRGQNAESYWEQIPEKAQEYKLGFDYDINPI